jgi:hypothetical protein
MSATMSDRVLTAIRELIEAVMRDESHNGGLLSRDTLRRAYLLYEAVKTRAA